MSSHRYRGGWSLSENEVMKSFSKVTDDDLVVAKDEADHLVGVLQRRYGYSREEAEQAWHAFATHLGIERMNAVFTPEDGIEPGGDVRELRQPR